MAAPQMPEGRRPVWIQSRFMEATRRSAVLATYKGVGGEVGVASERSQRASEGDNWCRQAAAG